MSSAMRRDQKRQRARRVLGVWRSNERRSRPKYDCIAESTHVFVRALTDQHKYTQPLDFLRVTNL